jgi:hypothetical protein
MALIFVTLLAGNSALLSAPYINISYCVGDITTTPCYLMFIFKSRLYVSTFHSSSGYSLLKYKNINLTWYILIQEWREGD